MDTFLDNLKDQLSIIKTKLNFESLDVQNKYLDDYLSDNNITGVADILTKIEYKEIESKLIITKGYFEGKSTITPDDINYISLIEDAPHYSVGIFFMPKGSVIPLHDHANLM